MPADPNTSETYDNTLIREDLQEFYSMISPEEVPFQTAGGSKSATHTLVEWPVVELQAPDAGNRVPEGESGVPADPATLGIRFSNITQISDKVASISHTAQAVDAAANNVQRMNEQVVLKLKELKRDKEMMLLSNIAAAPGSSGVARVSAGMPAFLVTNTIFGVGGADPVYSGGTSGFPTTAAVAGTPTLFLESQLNDIIESCWNEGAEPSIIMVNSGNKRRISSAFVGNSSRYKDAIDKLLVAAIDFYDSDFGKLTVVPNRFLPTNNPGGADDSYNVLVLDPEYYRVAYLDEVQRKPLAEDGHSMSTLVWAEYTLQVDNEKAHGVIRDTSNAVA